MAKIDLKKELKELYNPSTREVVMVDVPEMSFIMIDGSGDPNTAQEYKDAVEALYSLSYTLKFMIKKERGTDYGVMPLEGLWWSNNMQEFISTDKSTWQWTAMIMQPDFINNDLYGRALEEAKKKKRLAAFSKARLQKFHEGLAAQIMYLGPYADEGPTIMKIREFIQSQGYSPDAKVDKHHEIYLSDPQRTAPERLKTIIRQPAGKKHE